MTTRSYTDGDEIPAQPTVRSAWDAVKGELTLLALGATVGGCFATASVMQAVSGHSLPATLNGVSAGIWGLLSAYRVHRTVSTLKNIPAPKP